MDSVIKNTKRILMGVGFVLGIVFVLFIINQFTTFYNLLYKIHPYLAIVVVSIIAFIVLYIVIKILMLWISSPRVLVLSENPSEEEYQQYLIDSVEILKKNKNLKHIDFDSDLSGEEKLTTAFKDLDELSLPIIKQTASEVFLTTSISQNGSLDSLMVLSAMLKLIWKLANIYQTRPTVKSMGKLYLQVGSVVFMARTLEEEDIIEEQLEPIIASIVGESLASMVPGVVPIANLIVSSIMEGSINAFLTLRVGIITQSYLGMEVPQSKRFVKRSSSLQAVSYIGAIVKDNGKIVASKVAQSIKNAGSKTAKKWFGKKETVEGYD